MAGMEEDHPDVLQNIELGIVATHREHPEMSDYDVMRVLEALIDAYRAEGIGRPPRDFGLSDLERLCMDAVRGMCDWRLGRTPLPGDPEGPGDPAVEPVSVDTLLLCLKQVLKSVKRWNREGGRQGYLDFVGRFM